MQHLNANYKHKLTMRISNANCNGICTWEFQMHLSNANFKRKFETRILNVILKCKVQMQTSNAKYKCKS